MIKEMQLKSDQSTSEKAYNPTSEQCLRYTVVPLRLKLLHSFCQKLVHYSKRAPATTNRFLYADGISGESGKSLPMKSKRLPRTRGTAAVASEGGFAVMPLTFI